MWPFPFNISEAWMVLKNSDWQVPSTFLLHLAKEIFRLWIGLGKWAICHTQEGCQLTGQRQLNGKEPEKHALEEKIGDILSGRPKHLPSGSVQVPFYHCDQSSEIEIGEFEWHGSVVKH